LTLHENDGVVNSNPKQGYISYWQPHKDSELGMAIVSSKGTMFGFEKYITDKIDQSNAYAHLKVEEGKVVYYAGFGWKESEQYKNKREWEAYLALFVKKINNPIAVKMIN
ncbi:MAG: DUF4861 domain-containing protein, partial [Maribacter sp.]|nr:DUF4861 domain-containing protein [Maribacter sp.]